MDASGIGRVRCGSVAISKVLEPFARADPASACRRGFFSAAVAPTAVLGDGVAIGPFVSIGNRTRIGSRVVIHAGCFIGDDVVIGDDCEFFPNVTIRERITIGSRVAIHAGSVLGTDGLAIAGTGSGMRRFRTSAPS